MTNNHSLDSQTKQNLWKAADKLRSNMDAAEYKHVVLGLIFLKYISDSFEELQENLKERLNNPNDEYYEEDPNIQKEVLEDKDEYISKGVFWVPEVSRWSHIRDKAKQLGLGKLIDDAMSAIEDLNPKLKGILNKNYARLQLDNDKLAGLIDLISQIGFTGKGQSSKDILGQVYEYFLGQFATVEGKKGGQFYTPASIVRTLVEIMAPHTGRVYDPCCGSGGMFVQSEKFLESHGGRKGDISIYGQESNHTTWRLAAMNLAIRGIDFNLGKEAADTFSRDLHPDLKADFIMANPPFNISDWGGEAHRDDIRWKFGIPPVGNANFAWVQHIIHHLAPNGRAGIVLANGSMSSTAGGEDQIRKNLVEADLVECMVSLPGQLFSNTQIPACLWFFNRNKKRKNEVLFIDARDLGQMETRVLKIFTETDIKKIASTFHAWVGDGETNKEYEDIAGFCKAASLEEIKKHDYVLTPGRYVGAKPIEDDGVDFGTKMAQLTAQLSEQFRESDRLEAEIKANLGKLGYAI